MRIKLAPPLLFLSLAFAQKPQTLQKPEEWQTMTTLSDVDLSGLNATQKKMALAALRTEGCVCGCVLKIAECRVKDPSCGDSRNLARIVIQAVKEDKNPQQALADSDLVKRRAGASRLLEDPISIPVAGAPVRGPATARITLVEFSDFECPFCARAAAKLEEIQKAYPKDVRLIYKQYPLESHPHARIAAQAALAAKAQGKFWPMHDQLFAGSRSLSAESIAGFAKQIGLDTAKFQSDLHSAQIGKAVEKDMADGDLAQVEATPTVFINGKRFNGPLEISVLKPIFEAELSSKEPRP